MLAIATPSIAQQRIILVVFFSAIGLLAWWQNADGIFGHTVQKIASAHVPQVAELDFANAEAGWSGLQIDTQGNLKIDALTETALIDALALVQDHPSDLPGTRMAFLLEKQFGATASRQIMELLPVLKRYKEAEQRWSAENGSKNPPPYAELFRLQDEILGKTLAEKMFSEQRRLMNTMLASYRMRSDASPTQGESDRALIDPQESVPEERPPVE